MDTMQAIKSLTQRLIKEAREGGPGSGRHPEGGGKGKDSADRQKLAQGLVKSGYSQDKANSLASSSTKAELKSDLFRLQHMGVFGSGEKRVAQGVIGKATLGAKLKGTGKTKQAPGYGVAYALRQGKADKASGYPEKD